MRFALLGEHPDGLAVAQALVDSGRHQIVAVSSSLDADRLRTLGEPRYQPDVEEILADPSIEAIVMAGSSVTREQQLCRALQSERDVLCVHLQGEKPDLAYEAAMIQADVQRRLTPILPDALHPAIARLAEFVDRENSQNPIGLFRLLSIEIHATDEVAVPWDVLRRLGGEVLEIAAFSDREWLESGQVLLLAGRFVTGGLFHATLVPRHAASLCRLRVFGGTGAVTLTFPQGWHGPAFLDVHGQEEAWPTWDRWAAFVEAWEADCLSWQDEVRFLELNEAVRLGVEKRRSQSLDYQDVSEEVGFKGTMTLTGCALLWGVLLMLIVSVWVPWVGWLILPLLVVFIALQFLRYLISPKQRT